MSKLTEALSSAAQPGRESALEVVVELRPHGAEDIATRKAAFEADASPVEAAIRRAGGETLGKAWINETLRARVPARSLGLFDDFQQVDRVDLPQPLTRE